MEEEPFTIIRASLPHREEIVIEVHFEDHIFAELRFESLEEGPRIQIYGKPGGVLDLDVRVFERAMKLALQDFYLAFSPEFKELEEVENVEEASMNPEHQE